MRLRVRTKLLLSVVFIISVVLGTSTYLQLQSSRKNYLQALEWRSEALAAPILELLATRYLFDAESIQKSLGDAANTCQKIYEANKEKNVAFVAVIALDGTIAAHNDVSFWNTAIESPVLKAQLESRAHETGTMLDDDVYHTLIPIVMTDDKYVGMIDIAIPKTAVDAQERQLLRNSVKLFAYFLLLALVLLSVFMYFVVTKPIRRLVRRGKKIAQGELVDAVLSEAQVERLRKKNGALDEIDELNLVFRDITMYRKEMAQAATRIAQGDLSQSITPLSKDDVLGTAFHQMSGHLMNIQDEVNGLVQAIQTGDLSYRSNIEPFSGSWQRLVSGVNNAIEAFVAPITSTAERIDRIAKGEIPEKIGDDYKGGFNDLKNDVNVLIDATQNITRLAESIAAGDLDIEVLERSERDPLMGALKQMLERLNGISREIDAVNQAVLDGKLTTRGNVTHFQGGWQELVSGLNHVIDAFVAPIRVTADSLDRLAKGDLPDRISEEYQGDFNLIKDNLNALIDTMEETTHLAEEISVGNLMVDVRERSERDRLMKALNRMIRRLNSMTQDVDELVYAVQDGQLDVRGKAEQFDGVWHELVLGINSLIDAFVDPIAMTAGQLERIASGDIPEKIDEEYQGDFNKIRTNLNVLIEATNDIAALAGKMAEGDFSAEIAERSAKDSLMQALNTMILNMKNVVIGVKSAADTLAASSEELSAGASMMSEGSSQQAAGAEEVSSSMQQMAANIKMNAENAKKTEAIALQSAKYAEEGGTVVSEMVEVMKKIVQKITIIEEIAGQTRLLSLNATIEAARAQEHGKAFSVVASEVRKLSDVTKGAAEEINLLATSSLEVSERAVSMLTTLVPSIHQTADLVQEISAASGEQSLGAEQVNLSIQQLDEVTQRNSLTAESIASTAGSLANQAEQLQTAMEFFHIQNEAASLAVDADAFSREPRSEEGRRSAADKFPAKGEKKLLHLSEGGREGEVDGKTSSEEDDRDAEFERY